MASVISHHLHLCLPPPPLGPATERLSVRGRSGDRTVAGRPRARARAGEGQGQQLPCGKSCRCTPFQSRLPRPAPPATAQRPPNKDSTFYPEVQSHRQSLRLLLSITNSGSEGEASLSRQQDPGWRRDAVLNLHGDDPTAAVHACTPPSLLHTERERTLLARRSPVPTCCWKGRQQVRWLPLDSRPSCRQHGVGGNQYLKYLHLLQRLQL